MSLQSPFGGDFINDLFLNNLNNRELEILHNIYWVGLAGVSFT